MTPLIADTEAVRSGLRDLAIAGHDGSHRAVAVLEGSWGEESRHVATEDDALTLLRAELRDHDVVLVSGLPRIAAALEARA